MRICGKSLTKLSLIGLLALLGSLASAQVGKPWAWGYNAYGQAGDRTTSNKYAPTHLYGLTAVTQVAEGGAHSLALKSDGTVWTCGENSMGELGDGTNTPRTAPVQVSILIGVVQIAGGKHHSLALKSNGTVWAWGWNEYGQLGNGTTNNSDIPRKVSNLSRVVQIVSGGTHSLALKSNGTVWTWGYNASGQLGDGTSDTRAAPVQVVGLTGIVQIAGGKLHSLALKSDGTVWAWGDNEYGQLGNGTTTARRVPTQTLNLANQTYIAADGFTSLAVQATPLNTITGANAATLQYATPFTIAATLTDQYGVPLVFKPVDFSLDGTSIGVAYTAASGVATLSLPSPTAMSVRSHTLLASFAGDRLFNNSSVETAVVITKANTKVAVSDLSIAAGNNSALVAALRRNTDGVYVAGETLIFKIDGNVFGQADTDGAGRASIACRVDGALDIGTHTITVDYAGDGKHNASTGANTLTIKQASTKVKAIDASGVVGGKVALTAKLVRTTDAASLKDGVLHFQIGGTDIGRATTNTSGIATLNYTIPAAATKGNHPITAIFNGDAFYLSSRDSSANLTVK